MFITEGFVVVVNKNSDIQWMERWRTFLLVMLRCGVGSHPPACIVIAAETVCRSPARDAWPAAEARQLQHICTASLSGRGIACDAVKL